MGNNRKKKNKFGSLISTLATEAPDDSKALLSANGIKEFSNLQGKLAQFWGNSDDKIGVEKAFAAIHPHKDFILKYNKPEPTVIVKEAERETLNEDISSCDGNPDCDCEKKSGVDGVQNTTQPIQIKDNSLAILALIGIIGIFALVIHKSK